MNNNKIRQYKADTVLDRSHRLYLLAGLFFASTGLIADAVHYFSINDYFLLSLNLSSLALLLLSLTGFLLEKIKQNISAIVLIYAIVINILITDVYLFLQAFVDWQFYFLRGSFIIAIFVSITALLLNRLHIIVINVFYSAALFTIWKLSPEPNFISAQALFLSLLMAGFSYSLYMFNYFLKKSIKEKKQLDDLIAKQEKEVLITKNELAGIKAQQLENQLHFKNKELVSKALMIARDTEYRKNLINRLEQLLAKISGEAETELLNLLSDVSASEKSMHWDEFYKRFEDVHQDFYKKIIAATPGLTPAELKLAAFIKLGFSSKEISVLSHNTVSGIEVSRSRLRKKMKLNPTDNFVAYLSKF